MATKKELKADIEHQAQIISAQASEINVLHASLQDYVARYNARYDSLKSYEKWYQDANRRVHFLEKCLSKLRYVMALDIIQDGTHRSRNDYWRKWQQTVFDWLSTDTNTYDDIDEIPF